MLQVLMDSIVSYRRVTAHAFGQTISKLGIQNGPMRDDAYVVPQSESLSPSVNLSGPDLVNVRFHYQKSPAHAEKTVGAQCDKKRCNTSTTAESTR